MLPALDYDVATLGPRKISVPDPEPLLNRKAGRVIPVCEPDLRGNEERYVNRAVSSGWISSRGEYVDQFEEQFAGLVGARYGCAVSSGSTALQIALKALDIKPWQGVIMPAFTMVATINAAEHLYATTRLADCDWYYNLDPAQIRAQRHRYTRAIVPVHIYGHPCQVDKILSEADDIPVVWDACEAHGSLLHGKPIGGLGLASCYSFYANKTLTTGEGGMIVSNDQEFIATCRNLRDVAFSSERHFWHKRAGYNARMTNMQAAVGVAQCERFDELVAARRRNRDHYKELLHVLPGISFQPEADDVTSSCWMTGIEIDPDQFGMTRDQLRERLAAVGIETRTYFVPLHLQPYYRERYKLTELPVAERLSAQGLLLPSSSLLTDEDRKYVATFIWESYREGLRESA